MTKKKNKAAKPDNLAISASFDRVIGLSVGQSQVEIKQPNVKPKSKKSKDK